LFLFVAFGPCHAAAAEAGLTPWGDAQAPQLSLTTLDRRVMTLEAARGRAVVVHFMATWCEPCREELATLAQLARQFADAPFVILAVDVAEPEARVRRFLAANPLSFDVGLDPDRSAMKAWGVRTLPSSFVLGTGLRPLWRADGSIDWSDPDVVARISAAVAAAPADAMKRNSTMPANNSNQGETP
jgi:thiol-disulfide isomerase/thioredoxin